MKILLLTWACDRDDVSEPAIAYRWVSEIAKRHEVVLFAVSRPDRFGCVREQFPDLTVYEWRDIWVPQWLERFRAVAKPGYFLYFRRARKFVRELVQQQHFDLIHHLNPFTWRYATPAYGLGVPLVRGPLAGGLPTPPPMRSEVHEVFHPYKFLRFTDGLRKKFDPVLRSSYRHTDCVLVAAPYVVELLKPLPLQRVEIEIEHGLKTLPVRRKKSICGVGSEKIGILFVGRIVRTKGVRDAIRALAYMKLKERVMLTIIGDGEDLEACRQLMRDLKLQKRVFFRGWCSTEKVEQAYQDADIFAFPSFREPTGGVLLEAMSHGLACVSCDYGGPSYMVTHESGILVPPSSPDLFSKKIAEAFDLLVSDRELRLSLGKNGRRLVFSRFFWGKKINRIDDIYTSICKQVK